MPDLSKDLCVISLREQGMTQQTRPAEDFVPRLVRGRLAAMAELEKLVRATGNVGTAKNANTSAFIEGTGHTRLKWGPYRVDVVELPKECK